MTAPQRLRRLRHASRGITFELNLKYPDSPADAVQNASHLWLTDLADPAALQRGRASHHAWKEASSAGSPTRAGCPTSQPAACRSACPTSSGSAPPWTCSPGSTTATAAATRARPFTGRYTEAATLARAAQNGTRGIATPTLTAHFHAMEACALARLHDTKACGHALSQTTRAFERTDPQNDPPWFQYFDESELAAELGHCLRDLGRAADAVQHGATALGSTGEFVRSDFSSLSSWPTPTWPQAT